MAAALNVWMNGLLVGVWEQNNLGVDSFQYDQDWIASDFSRPLSNSLPINVNQAIIKGDAVTNYFDNLLPDSMEIRKRIQSKYSTKSAGTIELLEAIGRDCVGAVQILPIGEAPVEYNKINSRLLNANEIEEILIAASSGSALGQDVEEDNFRISIAGAQEKTALLKINDDWHLPLRATPTTHILKLPLGLIGGEHRYDMTASIENEWLCAKILERLGFNTAKTEIATFAGTKALIVERFDRKWVANDSWIARIPQEDFCQVFGLPSDKKYENKGGPSIAKIMKYLSASDNADVDRLHFIKSQFVFWLLAATDGHAKNFSVSIDPGGKFKLTPLYDVLSAWPIIGNAANKIQYKKTKLAMAIRTKNDHYNIDNIFPRHWEEFTKKLGVPQAYEEMHVISNNINKVIESIYKELPKGFPVELIDSIQLGVEKHVAKFKTVNKVLKNTIE